MRKFKFKFGLPYYGIGIIIISLISAQLNHDFTKRHFVIIIFGLILLTIFWIKKGKDNLRRLKKC